MSKKGLLIWNVVVTVLLVLTLVSACTVREINVDLAAEINKNRQAIAELQAKVEANKQALENLESGLEDYVKEVVEWYIESKGLK